MNADVLKEYIRFTIEIFSNFIKTSNVECKYFVENSLYLAINFHLGIYQLVWVYCKIFFRLGYSTQTGCNFLPIFYSYKGGQKGRIRFELLINLRNFDHIYYCLQLSYILQVIEFQNSFTFWNDIPSRAYTLTFRLLSLLSTRWLY